MKERKKRMKKEKEKERKKEEKRKKVVTYFSPSIFRGIPDFIFFIIFFL